MIEWGAPWAFALLVPVLLLPMQRRLTGVNRLAVPDAKRLKRRLTARVALAWLPGLLRFLGLVLLVIAFARPRITRRDVVVESEGLDILLTVDTSGSMHAEDFQVGARPTTRLEVAKGVMDDFIEKRPYDRIGVVVFGQEAFTHVPLTLDHDTLRAVLEHVDIGIAGPSATAIGTAIAVSARRLLQVEAPERIIILLTDGRNNAGEPPPKKAAQAAAALGIRVYTIGVGARSGGFLFGGDGLDEPTLKEIATITGGQYFRATDTASLRAIYDTIDALERSPAEVRELVEHDELYRRFLAPGFFLLLASVALGSTWLRRSP